MDRMRILVFCICINVCAAANALTLRDDAGLHVTVPQSVRIVTLAPFLTELVFAAGAGDRLVGVSAYSDFPPAAKKLPAIVDVAGISFESLIGLHPTLVLGWKSGNRAADLERVRQLGIPLFAAEAERLDDIPRLIRAIGTMAHTSAVAEAEAKNFESALAQLQQQYAKKNKVRVFVEISHQPMMTVSGRHSISSMIRICGGENVFADTPGLTPMVEGEGLLRANPEVVLVSQSATGEVAKKILTPTHYQPWPISAVKNGQFYAIEADYLLRPAPRSLKGIAQVCEALESVRARH